MSEGAVYKVQLLAMFQLTRKANYPAVGVDTAWPDTLISKGDLRIGLQREHAILWWDLCCNVATQYMLRLIAFAEGWPKQIVLFLPEKPIVAEAAVKVCLNDCASCDQLLALDAKWAEPFQKRFWIHKCTVRQVRQCLELDGNKLTPRTCFVCGCHSYGPLSFFLFFCYFSKPASLYYCWVCIFPLLHNILYYMYSNGRLINSIDPFCCEVAGHALTIGDPFVYS